MHFLITFSNYNKCVSNKFRNYTSTLQYYITSGSKQYAYAAIKIKRNYKNYIHIYLKTMEFLRLSVKISTKKCEVKLTWVTLIIM